MACILDPYELLIIPFIFKSVVLIIYDDLRDSICTVIKSIINRQ